MRGSQESDSTSTSTEEERSLTGGSPARSVARSVGAAEAIRAQVTEGQYLLRKLARRYTEKRIARRCGVTQPIVSRWISGKRKPNYENRKLLMEEYQIPMDAWDRRAE